MNRKQAAEAIRTAFRNKTGWKLNLTRNSPFFHHVACVSTGAETPEQAASAIYKLARIFN